MKELSFYWNLACLETSENKYNNMNRGAQICHELAVNSLESCTKVIAKNASEKRCLIRALMQVS